MKREFFTALKPRVSEKVPLSATAKTAKRVKEGGIVSNGSAHSPLVLENEGSLMLWRVLANPDDYESAREYFEERAGVAEYDGGLSRFEAEAQALNETIRQFNRSLH